jgi:hypothetical protein
LRGKHIKTALTTLVLSILLPLIAIGTGFAQTTAKASPNKTLPGKAKPPVASKSSVQQTSPKAKTATTGQTALPDKKKTGNVSTARRAELLKFCEEHHKELLPLLESLRKKRPAEFERALKTLDREINQLQAIKIKSIERYEKLLAQWVLRSRIKLLSARLAVRSSKEQRAKTATSLSKLIGQLQDLRIKHLSEERQALQNRMNKVGTQIDQLRSNRNAEIKKQMDAFTKNAERLQAAQKAKVAGKNKLNQNGKQPGTKQEQLKKNQAKKNQTKKPGNKKD